MAARRRANCNSRKTNDDDDRCHRHGAQMESAQLLTNEGRPRLGLIWPVRPFGVHFGLARSLENHWSASLASEQKSAGLTLGAQRVAVI